MPIRKPFFHLTAVYLEMESGLQNTHLFSTLGIPYIWVSGGSLLWCLLYVWRDVWVLFLSHSINWAVLDSSPKAASSLQATLLLHASYLNNLLLYHPCWPFSELLSPKSRKRVANAVANSSQQHCVVKAVEAPSLFHLFAQPPTYGFTTALY